METLGKFERVRKLGQGGFAEVWLARMGVGTPFQKDVALKVLLPTSDANHERFRKSLENEGKVGAKLRHPCIVDSYEFGEADGRLFMAMEFVDGVSLQTLIDRSPGNRLSLELTLEVAYQVARGLEHAHAVHDDEGRPSPIVHRDLKPDNVLLGWAGQVKLADFGIARWSQNIHHTTATGLRKGTPSYMSPEQATDPDALGPESDLFALGTLLMVMATGKNPYPGKSMHTVLQHVVHILPDEILEEVDALCPDLGTLLAGLVVKDPKARQKDTVAVRQALFALRSKHPLPRELSELLAEFRDRDREQVKTSGSSLAAIGSDEEPPVMSTHELYDTDIVERAAEETVLVETAADAGRPLAPGDATRMVEDWSQGSERRRRGVGLLVGLVVVGALALAAWMVLQGL